MILLIVQQPPKAVTGEDRDVVVAPQQAEKTAASDAPRSNK